MLSLEAVLFNHNPESAKNGALNVRRNARDSVTLPEWQRGTTTNPEDSPVAYALSETAQNVILVQAQFRQTPPSVGVAQVRALERPGPDPSVFGELAPATVTFGSDGSGIQTFRVARPGLGLRGVGVVDLVLQWQSRSDPDDEWQTFAESRHRIYVLLALPSSPWTQEPFVATNTQLPWAEVLEFACRWAAGAETSDQAAQLATRAVYELGPEVVQYGCSILGATQYSWPYFNCSAFLDRLEGGLGNGQFVNCTDCATVLSTFANALGCDLWQSVMAGPVPFRLNPILAIGSSQWRTACDWGAFNYHEVAWTGVCGEGDDVYDACLLVDGGADPTRPPHEPLLPAKMRFGGPGQYRERLASPAGRPNCVPVPTKRQRRFVI